ncbi:MAG: excinuclease ABC subunit UvrC, partial [Clostridia bacterium]|nr:excinuclease ABC subunit UvrC [Clostridia bacterium]
MDKAPYMPDKPGVYLFRDREGRVIYVGKAVSLKNRVRSYFQPEASLPLKTRTMRKKAYSLEYILTDNEVEALILEANLIKEHWPQYSIVLKDDKSYPYLKITWQERFPRLLLTRRALKDGAKYYGPYSKPGAVQEVLALLKRVFPLRTCRSRELPARSRPCLNYHIHRCLAPCCALISESAYRQMVQQVCWFLEGRQTDLQNQLQAKMEEASEALNFEEAALYRDQLRALHTILAKQKITLPDEVDRDILALACQAETACLMLFFVRRGKLLGRERFILDKVGEESEAAIAAAFLQQYYHQTEIIPTEILLSVDLREEKELIETWLSRKKGSRVVLHQPQRGDKKKLLDMSLKNAQLSLSEVLAERLVKTSASEDLALLAAALGLKKIPERLECFDISNTQGEESVASLAVFLGGKPAPQEYRKFKIRTVQGANDFASIEEAVKRR